MTTIIIHNKANESHDCYLILTNELSVLFLFLLSDSSISTRVENLMTPVSNPSGIWHKDDTLENFRMKPSTSDLWREARYDKDNDDNYDDDNDESESSS